MSEQKIDSNLTFLYVQNEGKNFIENNLHRTSND